MEAGNIPDHWPWLLRLLRPEDTSYRPEGAGFLVDDCHVITCAHVVIGILGDSGLDGSITMEAPARPELGQFAATIEPGGWFPAEADGAGDIAVLILSSPLRDSASAPLDAPRDLSNHQVRCRGFTAQRAMGEISRGTLTGRSGPRNQWVQIDARDPHGFAVGRGFSGTPVWDDGLRAVVGMVTTALPDRDIRVGWMIPLNVIAKYWPPLVSLIRQVQRAEKLQSPRQLGPGRRTRPRPDPTLTYKGPPRRDYGPTIDYSSWDNDVRNLYKGFRAGRQLVGRTRWLRKRGEEHLNAGRYQEALTAFNKCLWMEDNHHSAMPALQMRGYVYRLLGRYEEALEDLNWALEFVPDSALALWVRGDLYCLLGRHDEALADLNHALDFAPDDAKILASRGAVYRRLGRYEEALDDLNGSLELDPDNLNALECRGDVHRLQGRMIPALTDLNRCLELDPDRVFSLIVLGDLYRLQSRYEEALDDLNAALELESDNADALECRGDVYRRLGRPAEALADLNRALRLRTDEDRGFALESRGQVYLLLNRPEEALTDLAQTLEDDVSMEDLGLERE